MEQTENSNRELVKNDVVIFMHWLYTTRMTIEELKTTITTILKQYDVEYAGVFGSVARGEAKPDSDVDIVVQFTGRPVFKKYFYLHEQLEADLLREVDLLTVDSINKYLKPGITKDLIYIYGQRPSILTAD